MTDGVDVEVLDCISAALAQVSDPKHRSAAICQMVQKMDETLRRLHGYDWADEELLSMSPLLIEALRHQKRMALIDAETDTGDDDAEIEHLAEQLAG